MEGARTIRTRWSEREAAACGDELELRVYTSRLLGQEAALVLHGGGNTSLKAEARDLLGDEVRVLYVKASGWDLATIEPRGFAAVRMDALLRMAEFEHMTDQAMVAAQRAALLDPYAPNPSVEAILHAVIPYRYVDHTHADAVVTLTNTPDGEQRIRDLYGERVLVVPYVMPGFILARRVYEMTRDLDWSTCDGIVLLHHGVFTFADDARTSYERMIEMADRAERALVKRRSQPGPPNEPSLEALARLRRAVSRARGRPMLAVLDNSDDARAFASLPNVADVATRGPLTPDHVIRTKRSALIVGDDVEQSVESFASDYVGYFERNRTPELTCLDPAPRWAVWPGIGRLAFGEDVKAANIVSDIVQHTCAAIMDAEALGGWRALPESDIFEVEYWELEQAKLKKAGAAQELAGRIALVTGAASGIGKACVEALRRRGAVVAAVDIDARIEGDASADVLPLRADLTVRQEVESAVARTVRRFGGLDIVISNAGNFPPSARIEAMSPEVWAKSLALNLTSHQQLLAAAIPFLKHGLDPAFVLIASKNVPAPGPGAGAYSVAKAGATQLARVAALELGAYGIRVNVLHPNQVFDTAIWTEDVLAARAQQYGLSVDDYKRSNVLRTEITSADVAELACVVAGPAFRKTTGAQIPIDGGNERVI